MLQIDHSNNDYDPGSRGLGFSRLSILGLKALLRNGFVLLRLAHAYVGLKYGARGLQYSWGYAGTLYYTHTHTYIYICTTLNPKPLSHMEAPFPFSSPHHGHKEHLRARLTETR